MYNLLRSSLRFGVFLVLVWACCAPALRAQEAEAVVDFDQPLAQPLRSLEAPQLDTPAVREPLTDQDVPGGAARLNPLLDLGVQALDERTDQDAVAGLRMADLDARLAAAPDEELNDGRGDGAPLPRLGLAATPPLSKDELDNGRGDGAPLPRLGLAATPPLSAADLDNGRGDLMAEAAPLVVEADASPAKAPARLQEAALELPEGLALSSNYPNPFNPTTEITFTVHEQGHAALKVYDVAGREVATLFDGATQPGQPYRATFEAGEWASGVYLYRLTINGLTVQKKMLLTK